MIFALDVGNSNIVFGCIDGSNINYVSRIATDIRMTDKEYAVRIRSILKFDGIDYKSFEGVALASVVPPITECMSSAIQMLTGQKPLIIGAGIKTGLNIQIDNPAQLGADLVIGAVAATELWKPPLIIIDMGTATTFSVIDSGGIFRGGAITPGLRLSLDALSHGTSQLPKIPIEAPKNAIGKNSIDSMKSGGVFGTSALLDGMIDRFEAELGEKATIIATGGIAALVTKYCTHNIIVDDNLLLRGLGIVWYKNKRLVS